MSMTTRALSKRPRNYILKSDRDKENPPVFQVRSVDIFEIAEATGDAQLMDGSLRVMVQNFKSILKLGLTNWDNLLDTEGEKVAFSEENFSLLPFNALLELTNEISGQVSAEEEKNSETPSS